MENRGIRIDPNLSPSSLGPTSPSTGISTGRRKSQANVKHEVGLRIQISESMQDGQHIYESSPIDPWDSPLPAHHRFPSPPIEVVDEQEDYFLSIQKSFGQNKLNLNELKMQLLQWRHDLTRKILSFRLYHRSGLLKSLSSIREEIVHKHALVLLGQLKNYRSKNDKNQLLATINYLNSEELSQALEMLQFFEEDLNNQTSSSVPLTELPTHVTPTSLVIRVEQAPSPDSSPLPGMVPLSDSGSELYNTLVLKSELKREEINDDPWALIYKTIETALGMLYPDLLSHKSVIHPSLICTLNEVPQKLKLDCLIQIAKLERNRMKTSCLPCCCLFRPKSTLFKFFECVAALDIATLTQDDVSKLKASLKAVATYLVIDEAQILKKHLRFGPSSEEL